MRRFKPLDQHVCRQELGWSPDKFIILFSTTSRSNTKKRLWIAEEVVEKVKQNGFPDIELRGLNKVPHEKVPVWINAADMTMMTSMYDEGSPNIIKETLCCNKPVVSLPVGDVAERISGVPGCYLCAEDINELAQAVISVINGKRTVEGQKAMKNLSLEAIAQKILKLYGDLI